MLCACVVDVMDVVFSVYCEAWSCRCSCMGSVSVSSCRCCMFVSCVHPVAVLNAAFISHNFLVGRHECLLLFTSSCCSECFYDL